MRNFSIVVGDAMNVTDTVFKQDFSDIVWDDLKSIIEDKQTKIKYSNPNKRYDLAYRYKKSTMIWLFLVCVLAIALPVAESLYFENPDILWLILASLVFIIIKYIVGIHNGLWIFFMLCLFDSNSRVVC